MIQILFGIWLSLLKQICREFCREQFFFLLQPLKRFVKASKVTFKLFGKIISKKRGQALLGRPATLSAQPDSAARFPLPLSPARGRPPSSTRRRPHGGRTSASWTRRGRPALSRSGRRPAPPGHSILSPPRSPLLPPLASATAVAAPPQRHRQRAPPATPVTYPWRQNHRCTRLRRGKPLRMLYRGERPPRALNRSPEFPRPHQSAQLRRNLLVFASFRLLSSALGS